MSYLYKYIFCLFADNLYALSIIVVMKCMSFRFSAKCFNFEKHYAYDFKMFLLFLCFPSAKRMFPPCEPYVFRCGTVGFS